MNSCNMESFSISKGYGRIDHVDGEQDEEPQQPFYLRRRSVIVAAVSLLLLTATIVSLIVVLHHESDSDDDDEVTDPIKYACKFTQYQDACFNSISSINSHPKPDPVTILTILLRSTITDLALPKNLTTKVKDRRSVSALEDCASLFKDAVASLKMSAIRVSEVGEELTETAIGDLRTWISAAMTDQETCLDGLEEAEAKVVDEMRKMVLGAKVGMSNSLAILANMEDLKENLKKLDRQTRD